MESEGVDIPAGIDDAPQVLLWNVNEMAPIILGLVLGMITGNAAIFTGIGLLATQIYRRVSASKPDGFMIHMLYWMGLPLRGSRTIPNSFIRLFTP